MFYCAVRARSRATFRARSVPRDLLQGFGPLTVLFYQAYEHHKTLRASLQGSLIRHADIIRLFYTAPFTCTPDIRHLFQEYHEVLIRLLYTQEYHEVLIRLLYTAVYTRIPGIRRLVVVLDWLLL